MSDLCVDGGDPEGYNIVYDSGSIIDNAIANDNEVLGITCNTDGTLNVLYTDPNNDATSALRISNLVITCY